MFNNNLPRLCGDGRPEAAARPTRARSRAGFPHRAAGGQSGGAGPAIRRPSVEYVPSPYSENPSADRDGKTAEQTPPADRPTDDRSTMPTATWCGRAVDGRGAAVGRGGEGRGELLPKDANARTFSLTSAVCRSGRESASVFDYKRRMVIYCWLFNADIEIAAAVGDDSAFGKKENYSPRVDAVMVSERFNAPNMRVRSADALAYIATC